MKSSRTQSEGWRALGKHFHGRVTHAGRVALSLVSVMPFIPEAGIKLVTVIHGSTQRSITWRVRRRGTHEDHALALTDWHVSSGLLAELIQVCKQNWEHFFIQQYSNVIRESQNFMMYNWGQMCVLIMDPRVTERRVVNDLEHLKSNPRILAYFACVTFLRHLCSQPRRSAALQPVNVSCQQQLSASRCSLCTAPIKGYYRSMFSSL